MSSDEEPEGPDGAAAPVGAGAPEPPAPAGPGVAAGFPAAVTAEAGAAAHAYGPGAVAIGGDNYGAVTTNVSQYIRQFLLFGPRSRVSVSEMADRFAAAVREQWSVEATQLDVHGEGRLPVRWNPVAEGLCGSVADARAWARLHDGSSVAGRGAGWAATSGALAGSDLALADVWLTRTPTRRLVVLGEPGAGKSELMIRTVIEVLGRRAEFGGIVPIIVPAAAWDGTPHPAGISSRAGDEPDDDRRPVRVGQGLPVHSVELWLERWLIRNYRFLGQLAPGTGARSYAMALLRSQQIAIIVDGFDEVPPPVREGLLSYLRDDIHANPQRVLLLTSRPVEYTRVALTHTPAMLGAATGVRLIPQRGADVLEYLRRYAGRRDRWDSVAAAVERGGPLAAVLETPMMVLLADTVYNAAVDPPDPDDLVRYTSAKAAEQHLLDSYVAIRYHDHSEQQLADVTRWLRFLASSLSARRNPTDLAWWNLRPPPSGRSGPDGVGGGFFGTGYRAWQVSAVLAAAVIWTLVSAATFNGWVFQDFELGEFAAARVTAAAVLCFLMVVTLTRSLGAGVLAIAGAYIAGTISGGYDLAILAALAGGFAWRPLSTRRLHWWQLLLFAAAVATVGAVLQDDTPSTRSTTGTPWTMGFGAGFADGWSLRGDETVNGWLLTALVAGVLLWSAVRVTPTAGDTAPAASPPRLGTLFRRSAPVTTGAAVGVVTAVLGGLTDGVRADVRNGWPIGLADGWAAGVAVWCAAMFVGARLARPADVPRPRSGQSHTDQAAGGAGPAAARAHAVRRAWLIAFLTGAITIVVNGLGYQGRTNIDADWLRATADGIGLAVVVWYVCHLDRVTPDRVRGRFGGWVYAVTAAVICGCLDAASAGWGRAAITGLAIGLIVAHTQHVLRRPGRTGRGLLETPLQAGAFVAAVTGTAAGFAYGLVLGVVFGLAVQVSRDVALRRFPSRSPRLTWLGVTGGLLLGVVVAVAALFSGIPPAWLFPIAVTSGAVAAVAFGAQGEDVTEDAVLSPRQLLVQDRRTFLLAAVVIAVGLGLAAGIRSAAQGGDVFVGAVAALSTIVTYGVSAGLLIAVAQSRYGAYTVWRLIYATQGRLPWRLMTFLDDAHDRGILRRNGSVYQFRHQFLQERLTDPD